MIDYDKLKQAHILCINCTDYYFSIDFCTIERSDCIEISLTYANDGIPIKLNNLDDLIAKLQELTKPKPKYEVGDKVFYEVNNRIREAIIESIYLNPDGSTIWYYDNLNQVREEQLYPTREALIEAQIQYWDSQFTMSERLKFWGCVKNEEISTRSEDVSMPETCEHESDGITYAPKNPYPYPVEYKCIKCQEFY